MSSFDPSSEKDLKSVKRKQANRESARRSKLRKKAEADCLTTRTEAVKGQQEELVTGVAIAKERLAQVQKKNMELQQLLRQLAGLPNP